MNPKYKRMLAGMARREKATPKRRLKRDWSVYVLRCNDGSLYTGVTNDVTRRFKMHSGGTGARYTRVRGPLELVYQENGMTRSQALIRECAIKAMPKPKKEALVKK
jgi:predicted GIY-YIG superfamily endonuclease